MFCIPGQAIVYVKVKDAIFKLVFSADEHGYDLDRALTQRLTLFASVFLCRTSAFPQNT
jgi:hypothetical protein